MTKAKRGDTVKIHYIGTLDDGSVFDSSRDGEPLQLELGQGKVLKGLEEGVTGMEVGDSKKIHIKAADAYGEGEKKMTFTVDRKKIPDSVDLKIGKNLKASQPDGTVILVCVMDINDKGVTLKTNHPLAGKNINYDIELVEIV
jgi:peptidylprolyl isomerase